MIVPLLESQDSVLVLQAMSWGMEMTCRGDIRAFVLPPLVSELPFAPLSVFAITNASGDQEVFRRSYSGAGSLIAFFQSKSLHDSGGF
jgi:hypothetical protein